MKPKPKKVSAEQMRAMERLSANNPGFMEYAHHVGSFSIEKLNVNEMKNTALLAMHQQTEIQLKQIYEQVELLATQAQKIKERSDVSRRIYKAQISFKPIPGNTYYLYKKPSGVEVISMIPPESWGNECALTFVAAIKLLADHTWDTETLN